MAGHQILQHSFCGKEVRILRLIHYLLLECHLLFVGEGVRLETVVIICCVISKLQLLQHKEKSN